MESIDRLREYVHGNCATENERAILRMADAIEREVEEMRDFCERLDDAATKREDVTLWGVDYMPALEGSDAAKMDELTRAAMNGEDVDLWGRAYTALPVDADGVPIHVGDVMCGPFGKAIGPVWATAGDVVMFEHDFKGGYSQVECFDADVLRHHHAPTVEDVLREFADGLGVPVADSYLAATAAKLTLRGDE